MTRAFASVLLLATTIAYAVESDPGLVLSGLSVVDVESGEVTAGQTVIIRDGVIHSIEPDEAVSATQYPDAVVHDLSGRFAIPGLWDMHVHLRGGPDLAADNRVWLRQYLGFGVTTVRDAGGDLPGEVLSWKQAIAEQTLTGPRILTSLRKVDGKPVSRRGSVEIASQEDVPGAIARLKSAGADFIKVNDGNFPDSTFLEILGYSRDLGLPTAAHIPLAVSIDELATAGLGSIEHAYALLKFASADAQELVDRFTHESPGGDPFARYFGMYSAFAASIDDEQAIRAFRYMRQSGIAVTPTIYLLHRWFMIDDSTSAEDDPGYFETPASILLTHDTAGWIQYMNQRPPERKAADVRMVAEAQRLVGLAAEQGVTILAGSDTGTTNTFMYPGDSLHHELVELGRAGLSPLQALRAASINAAEWFGLGDEAGSIDSGKWADIVVLEDNPLVDIRNSRTIVAVIQSGRFYDRAALQRLRTLPDGE